MLRSCALVVGLLLLLPAAGSAQMISMKTVPVATGDQFMIHPSQNLALGGVSIAVDDPLLDPFVNPAKTARLPGALLFGAPTFYDVAGPNGSAKTLPLGGLFRSERWFGGGALALQEVQGPDRFRGGFFGGCPNCFWPENATRLSDRSATNLYASGLVGADLGGGLSIGASAFLADLDMLEGVELLYVDSNDIRQNGSVANVRLGLLQDFEDGRSVEALLLFNRVDMRHDVTYTEWTQIDGVTWDWRDRIEENLDISNTYGLHLGYRQDFASGFRVGGILTGNYKTHPKIPNYDLMRIPRDPGNSRAFNLGLGVGQTFGRAMFGVDLVYEPIWSDTWADTPTPIEAADGTTIPAGGKTVENVFEFDNAVLRTGVGRIGERVDLMLGLQVKAYRYDLDQTDNVEVSRRFQSESWQEWTGSLGLAVKFEEFHVRYTSRVLTGTGRPGVDQGWNDWWGRPVPERAFDAGGAADIILAPQGALTLQEARVVTHQVSIAVPLSSN